MDKEIYLADGIGGEHRVKYLDENRVIVQTVTRWNDLAIGESNDSRCLLRCDYIRSIAGPTQKSWRYRLKSFTVPPQN